MGRPETTRTTYVFDEAGKRIGEITTRDPEWTATDRAWLMALLAEEKERCGGCGHPLDICMDPDTSHTWTVTRVTCEACRMLEAEQDNDSEGERNRGRKYSVYRH